MDDKLFDKQIKAALDNLEAPYDPVSWAALEQRLNAPFTEEYPAPVDAVDKAVLRAFDRLETPYQPAHWEMLAARMTEVARLRRRIWITKLSEAAIFLLLLANLDDFFGISSKQELPKQQVPTSPHLQAEIPANQRQRSGFSTKNEGGNYSQNLFVETADYGQGSYFSAFQVFENQDLNTIIALQQLDAEIPSAAIFLNPTETPTPEQWESLPDIVTLPILYREQLESLTERPANHPIVQIKTPKQSRFYAGTFANFDQNYVRVEDYASTSNGYGGGLAVGYRNGKWGIETGVAYNRMQYQPKKEVEIYGGNSSGGYYGSFAKNVDTDVLSVPVKVTRRIAQVGKMSAHAVAGVTTNIALDKSYQYATTFYPGQGPSTSPDPDQQPQLRKTGKGLLENGSLRDNIYATVDAGVRLEHPVGRRLVAFVEPAYRHSLGNSNIGPKPVKINTFSMQAGVLATL